MMAHSTQHGRARTVSIALCATLLICGCAPLSSQSSPATAPVEPIGRQMVRLAPDLKGARFSNLLSFETDTDAVFVVSPDGRAGIDGSKAHAGAGSLRIAPGTPGIAIKLASLVAGRPFPGDWTLVGAYFYSDRAAEVVVTCVDGGISVQQRVELKPDCWTAVMLDLAAFAGLGTESSPMLQFSFPASGGATIWCDDLTLIDNARTFVGDRDVSSAWTIARRGFNYIGEMPGRFAFKLDGAEGHAGGWTLDEANPMRARFSSSGDTKNLTVYSDGRAYWDGSYRPMASAELLDARIGEEHASPADIEIAEAAGRLDRRSPGDANNDGYNETTATYRIIATGPRLELRITPRTKVLIRPVLEIRGLPAGRVLATVEGKLVEKLQRLDDGSVLVELPRGIERRTTINLSVQ